ncbi:hypothetical protein C8F01DRAFT_1237028 [Mycena amicta]|nr:hypothetical protein C8F01DRAFT_1237028 [Mycena amicta]
MAVHHETLPISGALGPINTCPKDPKAGRCHTFVTSGLGWARDGGSESDGAEWLGLRELRYKIRGLADPVNSNPSNAHPRSFKCAYRRVSHGIRSELRYLDTSSLQNDDAKRLNQRAECTVAKSLTSSTVFKLYQHPLPLHCYQEPRQKHEDVPCYRTNTFSVIPLPPSQPLPLQPSVRHCRCKPLPISLDATSLRKFSTSTGTVGYVVQAFIGADGSVSRVSIGTGEGERTGRAQRPVPRFWSAHTEKEL